MTRSTSASSNSLPSAGLLLRLGLFALELGRQLGGAAAAARPTPGSARMMQMGRDLASNVRLSEVALEQFPPSVVSELSG